MTSSSRVDGAKCSGHWVWRHWQKKWCTGRQLGRASSRPAELDTTEIYLARPATSPLGLDFAATTRPGHTAPSMVKRDTNISASTPWLGRSKDTGGRRATHQSRKSDKDSTIPGLAEFLPL